ncbi:hypothetical protein SUGI_0149520 [Cryptomeria japonica]|nr:hypothetical protein SUGI_0149520 [Cryptomeria japonica]
MGMFQERYYAWSTRMTTSITNSTLEPCICSLALISFMGSGVPFLFFSGDINTLPKLGNHGVNRRSVMASLGL